MKDLKCVLSFVKLAHILLVQLDTFQVLLYAAYVSHGIAVLLPEPCFRQNNARTPLNEKEQTGFNTKYILYFQANLKSII